MIKSRQKLGKYQIEKKLGEGGFAGVYRALDTIEGIRVALKIPYSHSLSSDTLEECLREVRLMASLDHPYILSLKNAEFIEGQFVLAFPLGEQTLGDRITKRMSMSLALSYTEQMLEAAAYAHERRIIHCDIKPDNMVLFPDGELQLTDFGIAKIAMRTIRASGSGTVGYIAPEQAMGRPSFRSDVFSLGLVIYRMFSGKLPEWPFVWPPPSYRTFCNRVNPEFVSLVHRSIEVDPKKRFRNAVQMLSAFRRIKSRALLNGDASSSPNKKKSGRDWRTMRYRQFLRQFGKAVNATGCCKKCKGPVSDSMIACPWCGAGSASLNIETRFPQCCPRCDGGMKLDWEYCPWCYGAGFEIASNREYSDKRYEAKCDNLKCKRRELMPFMRYCPWCRRKVRKKWKLEGSRDRCRTCGWGVTRQFWSNCPWCGDSL